MNSEVYNEIVNQILVKKDEAHNSWVTMLEMDMEDESNQKLGKVKAFEEVLKVLEPYSVPEEPEDQEDTDLNIDEIKHQYHKIQKKLHKLGKHIDQLNESLPEHSEGDRNSISSHLISLRKNKGWSKAETARRLGITPSTYSNWEYGVRVPSRTNAKKLAELFGVNPLEFIDLDSEG